MNIDTPKLFEALAEPFTDDELEWRILRKGEKNDKIWAQLAPYVDSRAIQNRLDKVVKPENWQTRIQIIEMPPVYSKDEAPKLDQRGMTIGIGIRIEGEWIWKWDGADFSRGMELTKSAISDGLKRAAVQWGIGRWLYTLDQEWANNIAPGRPPKGTRGIHFQHGNKWYWCPTPKLGYKPDPELALVGSQDNGETGEEATAQQMEVVNDLITAANTTKVTAERMAEIDNGINVGMTKKQAGELITELQTYR